jgi:cell wall-associated NlpC family hydrolase
MLPLRALLIVAVLAALCLCAQPQRADARAPGRGATMAELSRPLTPAAARETLGSMAARLALRWLGAPYRWGGASPGGFDCSGLVHYTYARLGVRLPHNAAAQFGYGRPVPRSRLRPGDLLFFSGLGHVGLYVGGGRMIHAPQSGERVEIVALAARYGARLVGARRLAAGLRSAA